MLLENSYIVSSIYINVLTVRNDVLFIKNHEVFVIVGSTVVKKLYSKKLSSKRFLSFFRFDRFQFKAFNLLIQCWTADSKLSRYLGSVPIVIDERL